MSAVFLKFYLLLVQSMQIKRICVYDASCFSMENSAEDDINKGKFFPFHDELHFDLVPVIHKYERTSLTGQHETHHYKLRNKQIYLHLIPNDNGVQWIVTKSAPSTMKHYFKELYYGTTNNNYSLPSKWTSLTRRSDDNLIIFMCIDHGCMNGLDQSADNFIKLAKLQEVSNETLGMLQKRNHELSTKSNQIQNKLYLSTNQTNEAISNLSVVNKRLSHESIRYAELSDRFNYISNITQQKLQNTTLHMSQTTSNSSLTATNQPYKQVTLSKNIWIFCGVSALFGACSICLLFGIYYFCFLAQQKNEIKVLQPMTYNMNRSHTISRHKIGHKIEPQTPQNSPRNIDDNQLQKDSKKVAFQKKKFKELMVNSVAIQSVVLDDIIDDMKTDGQRQSTGDDIIDHIPTKR